jgi:hypothetical protein
LESHERNNTTIEDGANKEIDEVRGLIARLERAMLTAMSC